VQGGSTNTIQIPPPMLLTADAAYTVDHWNEKGSRKERADAEPPDFM
jgi:hypothetical protein